MRTAAVVNSEKTSGSASSVEIWAVDVSSLEVWAETVTDLLILMRLDMVSPASSVLSLLKAQLVKQKTLS